LRTDSVLYLFDLMQDQTRKTRNLLSLCSMLAAICQSGKSLKAVKTGKSRCALGPTGRHGRAASGVAVKSSFDPK